LDPLIERYARGRVLDAGAGRLTYSTRLKKRAESLISMDRDRIREGLSLIGEIETLPFRAQSFDSIFCSQVLEHLPQPGESLQELFRVLKPGGTLLLSAPHLTYLHNEPHDYFRFTEYGLSHLLEKAGFECLELRWSGGLLSFLGHLPSTLAVNLSWGTPVLFHLVLGLNRLWSRGIALLESTDQRRRRFALNIAIVGRRPLASGETDQRA
jgi:SAM-dependent methyltransferase